MAEILPELWSLTVRGAALHTKSLTPAAPIKKIDVRVFLDRYFERRDEGRYALDLVCLTGDRVTTTVTGRCARSKSVMERERVS